MPLQKDESFQEKDRQSVLHPFTNIEQMLDKKIDPKIIQSAKGVFIYDDKGNKLLDAFAGLYCMNLGYGREEISKAIFEQSLKLGYYHTYVGHSTEVMAELSYKLLQILPDNMSKVFYGLSGSDANESNIKHVWYYHNLIGKPKKKRLIATKRGYHGSSILSGSLTGLAFYHNYMDLPLDIVLRFDGPDYYTSHLEGESELEFSKRRARELEEFILQNDPETIGAFFAEPVQGTGGIVPPPQGYFEEIQSVLKKYNILFVCDEVVTGFGRTGDMFGSSKYNIKPDLMTLAKGITSAYAPLSVAAVSEEIIQVFKDKSKQVGAYSHGYTYAGHPVCIAAALKAIEITEREDIPAKAQVQGSYLAQRMQEEFAHLDIVGDIRCVGLMAGIEFAKNKAKRIPFDNPIAPIISANMLKKGVITRAMPNGDILGFSPPLIISKEEIDIVIDVTKQSIKEYMDTVS